MKHNFLSRPIVSAAVAVLCAVLLALLGLQIVTHYDNKYSEKSRILQAGMSILPESGVQFLVDSWALYPDRLLSPADFASGVPSPCYTTWSGEWPSLAPFHEDGNPYGVATYRMLLQGNGMTSLYLQEPLFYGKEKDRNKSDCCGALEKWQSISHRLLFRKDRQDL